MPREPSAEGVDDISTRSTRDCHSSVQYELRALDTIVAVAKPGVPARLPSDEDALASRSRGVFTWSDDAVGRL